MLMMVCYAWDDVSRPCNESQLRIINKTCKKLKYQITSMQVVKYESTQVTPQPLEFRPAWGMGYYPLEVGGLKPVLSK